MTHTFMRDSGTYTGSNGLQITPTPVTTVIFFCRLCPGAVRGLTRSWVASVLETLGVTFVLWSGTWLDPTLGDVGT